MNRSSIDPVFGFLALIIIGVANTVFVLNEEVRLVRPTLVAIDVERNL
jgi:hypothetical protein